MSTNKNVIFKKKSLDNGDVSKHFKVKFYILIQEYGKI